MLWSSSPYVGYEFARGFFVVEDGASASYPNDRGSGFPVRCFKDSALGPTSSAIVVDSVAPTAYVEYQYFVSGTLATLTGYNKPITITNNG